MHSFSPSLGFAGVLASGQQPQPPPSHPRSRAGHLALGLGPMSLVNLPIPRLSARRRLLSTATRDLQELGETTRAQSAPDRSA